MLIRTSRTSNHRFPAHMAVKRCGPRREYGGAWMYMSGFELDYRPFRYACCGGDRLLGDRPGLPLAAQCGPKPADLPVRPGFIGFHRGAAGPYPPVPADDDEAQSQFPPESGQVDQGRDSSSVFPAGNCFDLDIQCLCNLFSRVAPGEPGGVQLGYPSRCQLARLGVLSLRRHPARLRRRWGAADRARSHRIALRRPRGNLNSSGRIYPPLSPHSFGDLLIHGTHPARAGPRRAGRSFGGVLHPEGLARSAPGGPLSAESRAISLIDGAADEQCARALKWLRSAHMPRTSVRVPNPATLRIRDLLFR